MILSSSVSYKTRTIQQSLVITWHYGDLTWTYFPNVWLEGTLHTSFSQSKVRIHFPPLLASLNFLTCEVEEKQRNEVTDWGRQYKNTSCKFLPSAWFTYHSGPGKTTRGFISNPAQVQSGCWEVAEVSMASKDFHKEYSDLAENFGSFGGGFVLWQMYRTEISGSFFFFSP